jgi:hypothetical protein
VSFLLVVVGIVTILAMAAMAIDVVTLYTAKSEAQKAADAAALAGAKMFVASGSTSGNTTSVCTGGATGTTMANVTAAAVAGANTVAGAAATITNVNCGGSPENPLITVVVGRTDLTTFFARIFGRYAATVTATATAEAFNNGGGGSSIVKVGSVKPWAIPNCDPTAALPGVPCGTGYFINNSAGYVLNTPAAYLGTDQTFITGSPGKYYAIDFSSSVPAIQATVCPVAGANTCSSVNFGANPYDYIDNIACASDNRANQRLSCGDNITLLGPAARATDTYNATQCLIHSAGGALGDGQDMIPPNPGNPPAISPGANNPNTGFASATHISRSDSVVTVPLFTWTGTDPCTTTPCGTVPVIGFLQLGIRDVDNTGKLEAVIMNAVGCDPGNPGTPKISGGGLTPIPVRLVR